MKTPSHEARKGLEALRVAVEKALERKRRLGQYAVMWVDGKLVYVGENAPQESETSSEDHLSLSE